MVLMIVLESLGRALFAGDNFHAHVDLNGLLEKVNFEFFSYILSFDIPQGVPGTT